MADRAWMYSGWQFGQIPSNLWLEQTNLFLDHAFSFPGVAEGGKIKCPCAKCRNYVRRSRDEVEEHLYKLGFREKYEIWTEHGEKYVPRHDGSASAADCARYEEIDQMVDRMDNMLIDLGGNRPPPIDEEPTSFAKAFYRMVSNADETVHENTTHSRLSAVARLLAMKSRYNISIAHYDETLEIIHELMPPDANLSKDFYQSKKLLEGLGMPYVKIDVCKNNCMLYYKDNEHKQKCDFCDTSRYEDGLNKVPRKVLRYLPLKERLQRLYAHKETAKHMQSHARSKSDKMVHPCDGEAWQGFDEDFPDFAKDRRNVRLVIATDGFTPYKLNAAPYTCWPVFVAPLNLPPGILLKPEYIFLSLVGKNLSVLMQPLADELMQLWEGVETWDDYQKVNFPMKAAFLWSVHDFPAFGMFAGWSTHGKLACPECLSDSKAFTDDWEQREIDVQLLYESSGGIPHGRLAIADGAIKKADVISKAREKNLRPSISASHRRTVQQNEELKRHNEILQNKLDIHQQLILALYKELGKELPADVLRQRASFQPHGTTNSSVDGSQTLDDNTGDCDSGGNGGGDNSGGNIGDQDINATNLHTNNITAGGGN